MINVCPCLVLVMNGFGRLYESGRHFDAASFIGGIVLCLGLGVIAFIGLKYYRSRSQQNYRTL